MSKNKLLVAGALVLALGIYAYANDIVTYSGIGSDSFYLIGTNGNSLQLKPGAMSSSFSLTMPTSQGSAGQYLKNIGSGELSWGTQTATLPAGIIIAYAGSDCTNAGYLAANGQAVSRTGYSALFTAIGTTWGVGDGSTTFNIPDLRNRYLRGTGTNGDSNGGDAVSLGAYQGDATAKKGLSLTDPGHDHDMTSNGTNGNAGSTAPYSSVAAYSYTNTDDIQASTTGITLGSTDNETRPKSYGVTYCITY